MQCTSIKDQAQPFCRTNCKNYCAHRNKGNPLPRYARQLQKLSICFRIEGVRCSLDKDEAASNELPMPWTKSQVICLFFSKIYENSMIRASQQKFLKASYNFNCHQWNTSNLLPRPWVTNLYNYCPQSS